MEIEKVDQLVQTVLGSIPLGQTATEQLVQERVSSLGTALGHNQQIQSEAIKRLHSQLAIKMDTGVALTTADHRPWLDSRKADIDPYFWNRFQTLLGKQNWPRNVVLGLSKTTDEILDLLGNPADTNQWARRGLVMGDVQSGKTATYTALTCKAADSGYRLVILLTGVLESLRRQTQERLDEGFVGIDSSGELQQKRQGKRVGVGLISSNRHATVFTSRTSDFKSATIQQLGLTLKSLREPALVVVKKNSRILKNLHEWLQDLNADSDGKIDLPMLLIDDEADNASINVSNSDDPTAINEKIRSILSLFTKSTYAGFTATPFANIFVDPDKDDDMLGSDLFPKDFIYSLSAPTNYFGANRIFLGEDVNSPFLREISDAEESIPPKHKSTFEVSEIPSSLQKALSSFIVANAIRDLRGHKNTHRSMLVNVSRFTAVQDSVEKLLHGELDHIQNDIRNFASLKKDKALKSRRLQEIHDAWHREYQKCEFTWEQIQAALPGAALSIKTIAVNQRTGAKALDYKAHEATGLRVIAVGGNTLSRGLTLEGLCISYFYRNSQMYDTLMQMGRWFGYRPGYEDICRIWMPIDAIDWYAHIAEATNELRASIFQMREESRTPSDFGLEVRAHPDSLIVTAQNKMRSAKLIERSISLSCTGPESSSLPANEKLLQANRDAVDMLLTSILPEFHASDSGTSAFLFKSIPKAHVVRLLRSFKVSEISLLFQPGAIADFLSDNSIERLDKWDIAIPQGNAEEQDFCGLKIHPQIRRIQKKAGALNISGNRRRVGSRGVERLGLDDEIAENVRAKHGENTSDNDYRKERERPLLLLHFLKPSTKHDEPDFLKDEAVYVAIGLSFPKFDDAAAERKVRYRANVVRMRELFGNELDDDLELQ